MTQVAVTVWAAVAGGIFGTLGGAALSVPSMIEAAATSEAVIALIKFLQVIDDQLKVQDDASAASWLLDAHVDRLTEGTSCSAPLSLCPHDRGHVSAACSAGNQWVRCPCSCTCAHGVEGEKALTQRFDAGRRNDLEKHGKRRR